MECQQVCEDYRVHRWGDENGIDWSEGLIEPKEISVLMEQHFPPDGSPIDADDGKRLRKTIACLRIASYGTGTRPIIDAIIESNLLNADVSVRNVVEEADIISTKAIQHLRGIKERKTTKGKRPFRQSPVNPNRVPTILQANAVARWLERMLETDDKDPEEQEGEERKNSGKEDGEGQEKKEKKATGPGHKDAHLPWEPMNIKHPPRPVSALSFKRRSGWRVSESGIRVRRPYRLLTDGLAFAHKKRAPGGTVLQDLSGSMHITTDELEALAEAAPSALLAGYSHNRLEGKLSILLANKHRVSKESLYSICSGNNFIDGPALRWLGKQKRPRIWVSDGYATVRDPVREIAVQPLANILECRNLLRRFGIIRLPKTKNAIEYFKTGRIDPDWFKEEMEHGRFSGFDYRV
jgi:hypothetical protein